MTDTLVITGTEVFDGDRFIGTHDVLVRGGVVEAVRSTEAGGTPLAAEASAAGSVVDVVDGTGKTLTPGLIDCHVHVGTVGAGSLDAFTEPFSLQFFRAARNLEKTLQAGVTTARDAGGADAGVKTALAQGLVEGPDLRAAISIMSQTGGHGDGRMASGAHMPMFTEHPGRPDGVADGLDGVRAKTREILRAGADHIKICSTGGVLSPADDPRHSQFTQAEIEVIVAEAAAQGTYVMSHAQGAEGIRNALRAGVRSIEHGIYVDAQTIELFLEKDAFLVPTLQAPQAVIDAADAGAALPPAVVEKARMVADIHREAIAAAHQAGVKIAMGTDAGVGPHGENLEELELMVDIGLSTEEALRAGTTAAAALLGLDSVEAVAGAGAGGVPSGVAGGGGAAAGGETGGGASAAAGGLALVGRVAPGYAADLVLFEGDLSRVGLSEARRRVSQVYRGGVRKR
ncbi:MAG: amidohydrolase family protein [Brevibacterium yomogidense]